MKHSFNVLRMGKARTIFTLVVLLTFMSSCKFFKEQKMFSKDDEMLEVKKEEPSQVEEEPKDTVEVETIEQEVEPVEIPEEQVFKEPGEGYGSDRYYMVVGSFLNKDFATKYAEKLLDQGYESQIIFSSSKNFYRVSAKSYDNFTVAVNDIENFRTSVSPKAWVHVKK